MENKNSAAVIIAGIGIVGVMVAGILGYQSGKQEGLNTMHRDMDMMENSVAQKSVKIDHSQMTMNEMTQGLDGLRGDAFDKAFVEMMIVHHQGAVDMAALIPANAKHAELKKLGQDIMVAQTKEITMMKQWLKDWGYENQSGMNGMNMQGMDHSMMGH